MREDLLYKQMHGGLRSCTLQVSIADGFYLASTTYSVASPCPAEEKE